MKKAVLGILTIVTIFVAFGYINQNAHGSTSAAPAGRTGSPGDGGPSQSCARSGCHTGGSNPVSGSANASITSTIPATGYIPGQTYTITGFVQATGLLKFGFQISPQNTAGTQRGTNVITDATNTQLVGGNKYVTHRTAGTAGNGSRTWSFNWVAPAAGTGEFSFYGAFNATNSGSNSSGDIVYLEELPIVEAAQIATQPTNVSVCNGANASFSVTATGTNITYQWKKNGVTLTNGGQYSGVTTANLTISNTTGADADTYTCEVTGSGNTVVSNAATLSIAVAPSITADPLSISSCVGQTATFSVTANGTNPTYQWKRNNTNVTNGGGISGATTNQLTITNVAAGNAGTYTCQVSNTCATPTSAGALLTINENTAISTQPVTQSLCTGANLTLTVGANGTNLNYQWKRGTTNVGTNSPTLTINNITAGDAGNYTCEITGACGNATSNAAVITINPNTAISTQPAVTQTLCQGSTVNLSVAATGTNLSYQWKRGNTNVGTNSSTLSIPNAQPGDAGTYTVTITGACGTVTSSNAVVNITPTTAITTQPVTQGGCTGANLTLTVGANGTNLNYQWKRGTTNVGTNSTTLTINNITVGDAGNYTCEITGACGNATSNVAVITINPNTAISTQPATTQTLCQGSTVNLSVAATGTNLSYQWKRGNTNVGTNSSTLSIPNAQPGDAGTYTVTVTGACGTVTSSNAVVNITPTTAITTQPVTQGGCTGANITFTVAAAGTNLSFQWKKGVTPVGTNSPTLTLNNITAGDAGNYTVEVTGTCGPMVTSNVAALSVVGSASIAQQPVAQQICLGGPLTLSVIGNGGNNTTYQWRRNGNNVGTSSATYTVPVATANDLGTYDVIISGSCGTITSNTVNVTALTTTSVNNTITNNTLCGGEDLTLTALATGSNLSYQWALNGEPLSGETAASIALTNVDTSNIGIYSITVTGDCGILTDVVIADLTITQPPVITGISLPLPVCPGSSIDYTLQTTGDDLQFQWIKNGVPIPNATNPSYNEDAPVNGDVISCSIWNSCDSINASFGATVIFPAPFVTVSQTGPNEITASAGFVAYQWLDANMQVINGANSQSYNPDFGSGFFYVVATDANGCVDTSAVFNYIPESIDENLSSLITAYPNPTNGDVYFNTPAYMGSFNVKIISSTGQLVIDRLVENNQLNIAQIPSGLYTVLINHKGKVARLRLARE